MPRRAGVGSGGARWWRAPHDDGQNPPRGGGPRPRPGWGAAVLAGSSPTMTTDRPVPAESDPDLGRVRDVLRNIPGLRADAIAVSRLPGGLTNRNYLVETPRRRVVVRLSSEQAALLAID